MAHFVAHWLGNFDPAKNRKNTNQFIIVMMQYLLFKREGSTISSHIKKRPIYRFMVKLLVLVICNLVL